MTRLELVGLLTTWLAVGVMLGSLVIGLRTGAAEGEAQPLLSVAEPALEGEARVRVEVLNAAGKPGLARAATRILRERRLDVVYFGNAPRFDGDSSVVIARTGDPEPARRVADALGIAHVRLEPDSTLYLEVTVVLGHDWEGGEPWPPRPRSYPAAAPER